jgi:RND family efflux transporter MFP subunit
VRVPQTISAAVAFVLAAGPAVALDECLIEPWKVIQLGARSTGVLETLIIDRGEEVAAGQLVASLNSEIERASLELAEARAENGTLIALASARAEYEDVAAERNESLFKRKIISAQQIEEARATHRIAQLQVVQAEDEQKIARLELKRAQAIYDLKSIRSPIDGIVISTDRTEGEFLDDGDHVATIAMIDPLRVEAFLPLERLPLLEEGARVKIFPQEPVGGEFDGVIDVVDRVVDARSGTIGIRIRVENPEKLTLAGLRCNLQFRETE